MLVARRIPVLICVAKAGLVLDDCFVYILIDMAFACGIYIFCYTNAAHSTDIVLGMPVLRCILEAYCISVTRGMTILTHKWLIISIICRKYAANHSI